MFRIDRLLTIRSRVGLAAVLSIVSFLYAQAQDETILYSVTDPGVTAAITNWGLDTCWPSSDNMQRGLIFMGTNNVTIVRVGFFVDAPLTNNDVTPGDKSSMQTCANLAAMATAATRWDMNLDSSVNAWYQSGANLVYPDRWAAAIEACQRYYNKSIWSVEGFNEPDYTPNGEGSAQNLHDIFGYLQASTNFPGTYLSGGSTLNDDVALSWFDPISPPATMGTTHCLAGSASSYVSFIQSVLSSNAVPFNPEMHNVMEAIMGANYGLKGGIWWGSAELARGSFVNACRGKQLGYADDWNNWTAAAVYRGTNGAVQAYLGGSERMATTTTYRFFSRDRDVFYDGHGPQRDYTVTVPGGTGYQVNQPNAEQVVNITWGADVQPAIGGRYIIVNCNSHLVLEVPGGGTANGIQLDQNTYSGALYQQWDVNPVPSNFGGDVSYFTMTAAHDRVTADLNNFSYVDGDQIQQWNGGTNTVEQWYFQYTTNGYFKIRSRWSGKCVGVYGAAKSSGAQIVQWHDDGSPDQQWRLIPATASTYDFIAPAAPTGVTAAASAVSVQLNWNTNTESDLASYTVLRGTTDGGPYEIVARGLTSAAFTDNSANQPQTYYYVVQAVDRSSNTSSNSVQVSATPTLAAALVAKYPFDGNPLDISGNGNNGVVTGTATYVGGKVGSAISLDGASNYVSLPAGMMDFTNFTVAAWVNWNGGAAWQRIFDFGNGTGQYMFLTPNSGSGTLRFAVTTNGNGAEQRVETSEMPTNQWVHVAVTYNGSVGNLYTNGVLAASTSGMSLSPTNFNPALNYLGKSQFSADPLFGGKLDEVLVTDYALSSAQVALLVTNHAPRFTNSIVVCSNAIADQPYAATIAGSAIDTDAGDSLTYRMISGPAWLSVAPGGAISGTPAPANVGTNNFLVSVFDIGGLTSSTTLTIYVAPAIEMTPTNLVWSVAGGTNLNLSWPAGYIGWTLESNSVGLTATGSWYAVSGSSSTNQISLPIGTSASNVFYRLVYP